MGSVAQDRMLKLRPLEPPGLGTSDLQCEVFLEVCVKISQIAFAGPKCFDLAHCTKVCEVCPKIHAHLICQLFAV